MHLHVLQPHSFAFLQSVLFFFFFSGINTLFSYLFFLSLFFFRFFLFTPCLTSPGFSWLSRGLTSSLFTFTFLYFISSVSLLSSSYSVPLSFSLIVLSPVDFHPNCPTSIRPPYIKSSPHAPTLSSSRLAPACSLFCCTIPPSLL